MGEARPLATPRCSFCGRPEKAGRRLAAGVLAGAYICEGCVRRCRRALGRGRPRVRRWGLPSWLTVRWERR